MASEYEHVELFTPAERTRRNARTGRVWGRFLGWAALAGPACVIASLCGFREAWNGGPVPDDDADLNPDTFPGNKLWERTLTNIQEQRAIERGDL